jgi:putative ABC transport system ATP-binding protein
MIIAEHLTKVLPSPEGPLTVVDDINFRVAASESVAIMGVSGSGKSTLLGLLAGLDTPTSGRVLLDGHDLSEFDEDARARLRNERVGFVFQSFHLLPNLTAIENVMLPLELYGRADARPIAAEVLSRVELTHRLGHYPRQLSGGEQQRVALARAFCARPRVLFADEPTGNLDARTADRIADLMFDLNTEFGTTLVLVTHNQKLADHCTRQVALDAGCMT